MNSLSNLEKQVVLIRENFNVLSVIISKQVDNIRELFLHNGTPELYERIEMNETIIDGMEMKIRAEVLNGIVLYTPRGASSRLMFAYHDMTAYLERIGDLLINIADFAYELNHDTEAAKKYIPILNEQLSRVYAMLTDAVLAFFNGDSQLAREVIERDKKVDEIHFQLTKELPEVLFYAEELSIPNLKTGLAINSISYNVERIGDNTTNIAEAVIFHTEGTDIKHKEQTTDELPHIPEQ